MNEAALQRLVDESDLRDLMQALPRALDEKNFDALGALFTEDGVHEIAGQIRRGRQAITDGPKGDLERLYQATYHHIGQIYVDLDGDEATIVAYIVAYHLPKAAEPMKHQDGGAKYHAVARRTEDGWRLTRARHEIIFFQGEPMSFDV
jgi:uncharacterized protein (TIGR02246 family)